MVGNAMDTTTKSLPSSIHHISSLRGGSQIDFRGRNENCAPVTPVHE
jgi:hypothetical protein